MKTTHHHTKAPFEFDGTTGFIDNEGKRVCTGSMMGRRDAIPDDFNTVKKLRLVRVPMSSCGAYDKGGAYWGCTDYRANIHPLYCAWGESETECVHVFYRAYDRADAKRQALCAFPNAKFFN